MTDDKPKVVIAGYSGHGKMEIAKLLSAHGFSCITKTRFIYEKFLFDQLVLDGYDYRTVNKAIKDKRNHQQYFDLSVSKYESGDCSKIAKKLLEEYNVYVGICDSKELNTLRERGLVDIVIWVDGFTRLGTTDPVSNIDIVESDADFVFDNNGSKEDLEDEIKSFFDYLEFGFNTK